MKPGLGFPSYGSTLTWSVKSNFIAAGSPLGVTNLSNLSYPSHVGRAAGNGYSAALGVFPAATSVQLLALINHNLQAGDTFRVRGYSSATPNTGSDTPVFDTGTQSAFPTGATLPVDGTGAPLYAQTRPFLLSTPATVLSLFLELQTASVTPQLVFEAAAWWLWPGVSNNRNITFDSREKGVALIGGANHVEVGFAARQVSGQIDLILLTGTNPYLDFQTLMDLGTPFVFASDLDDVTTYGRLTFLATNVELPALAGATYRADRFPFRFNEHMR